VKASICDVDQPISHVYVPVDFVISVVAALEGGTLIEVATVGAEGVAGLPAFLGASSSPHQAFCQGPGQAVRLTVEALRRFFTDDGVPHDLDARHRGAVRSLAGPDPRPDRPGHLALRPRVPITAQTTVPPESSLTISGELLDALIAAVVIPRDPAPGRP